MSSDDRYSGGQYEVSNGVDGMAFNRFQRLVKNFDLQDLSEIALAIAQQERPSLDLIESRETLADLVSEFQQLISVSESASVAENARLLCRFLFEQQGFAGNEEKYYDPGNSYLDRLLQLRRGIPISLALLYIHVGRAAGLEMQGIGFPGHFLVGVCCQGERALIDPFAGRLVTEAGLLALLKQQRGDIAVLKDTYSSPVAASEILLRMINNLRAIYQQQGDHRRVLVCCNQILTIDPENPQELFQRIAIYRQLDQKQLALIELTRLRDRVDSPLFRQCIESMMLEIDIDPGSIQ